MSADYHPISYIYIWVDNQLTYTGVIGVIISVSKRDTSKIVNSSRIPNLASKIGALCHIFRDIDVFSAFPEVALLGETLVKALKPLVFSPVLL